MAAGHPQQGMNVAQATGAAFDVGFKVIAGAVIAQVALLLLLNFGGKEAVRRPEAIAENVLLQLEEQRHVAGQHAGLNQIGGHRQIGQTFQQTLFQRAHAVADFQLQIPHQRQ